MTDEYRNTRYATDLRSVLFFSQSFQKGQTCPSVENSKPYNII